MFLTTEKIVICLTLFYNIHWSRLYTVSRPQIYIRRYSVSRNSVCDEFPPASNMNSANIGIQYRGHEVTLNYQISYYLICII